LKQLELQVLSGALAGRIFEVGHTTAILGRSSDSDLRLHPYEDRQVSSLHAMLVFGDDQWLVRDLDSRNGTFVNERRIEDDTPVGDGDVIRLGHDGPQLRLVLVLRHGTSGSTEETPTLTTAFRAGTDEPRPTDELRSTDEPRPTAEPRPGSANQGARRTWLVSLALLVLIAVGGVGLWTRAERNRTEWERERAALLLRLDSVLAENATAAALFEGRVSGLADSLRRPSLTVSTLVEELETISDNANVEQRDVLERQLEQALAGLAELRLAANLDWSPIRERATSALARVFVERESGEMESGTAFSVGGDGMMVTSGHLVVGPDGSDPPRRIVVQFAGTDRVLPAELITVAPEDDLAIFRVPGMGTEIGFLEMNQRLDSVQPGQAVVLMGFPLQQAASSEEASPTAARPLASAGVIQGITDEQVELSGFGARGASGSPVMDATGAVVGLLRGAVERDGRPLLIAVPSTRIIELIAKRSP